MATNLEERWKKFWDKYCELFDEGVKNKKIHLYDDELLEKLRKVYDRGLPASIILLVPKFCDGYCYDRALLLTHAFKEEEFRVVEANIDSIRLNPQYIEQARDKDTKELRKDYATHCFVEKTEKDGSIWVYDTTAMVAIEKELYYKMEEPEILKIDLKQATESCFKYLEVEKTDIDRDSAVAIISNIETVIIDDDPYSEVLKREIEIFKEKIGYDALCEEVEENRKRVGIANDKDTKLLVKMPNSQ